MMPDLSRVLVVGNSQINRIVVSKIVERSGLKPISEKPIPAVRMLPLLFPAIVIMDGGPDNTDCDELMPGILALRRISAGETPGVILLSSCNSNLALSNAIDAVVTKPFNTDQLQPIVDWLLEQARR
jgi:CheY-like chemotaxis protein